MLVLLCYPLRYTVNPVWLEDGKRHWARAHPGSNDTIVASWAEPWLGPKERTEVYDGFILMTPFSESGFVLERPYGRVARAALELRKEVWYLHDFIDLARGMKRNWLFTRIMHKRQLEPKQLELIREAAKSGVIPRYRVRR